jgi:GDP-L-fucose synthase
MMDGPIYVAGHRGLAGSAIVRRLRATGRSDIIVRTHAELDLMDGAAVRRFFETERPGSVFLAAAKVGGIHANNAYPADFIVSNLAIQTNVISEAYRSGVKRLLFLGSSCIYPRDCPQPMAEEHLLAGPLEPTNRPYAIAKIAGIEMCWSYNRQHATQYLAVMPTNLYGPGDNYHLENSHVVPALIRKMHEAKQRGEPSVVVWGSGRPRREFLYSDDMADACVFLMSLPDERFRALVSHDESPPLINVGYGDDITILDLAHLVRAVTGFNGELRFDAARPDGTPRKLLSVKRLNELGWKASTPLKDGIALAYADFLRSVQQ